MDRAAFFDRLRQSRLLSDEELEQAASHVGDDPARSAADALVEQGVLTPFQARQVCTGDTQPLSLGQYRLLDELGRGGMGRVYKALHTFMGRTVAIKVISPELVSDPVAVEWFRREVRASTHLLHPNIVMAYDANEAEGLHFLVMEYVHGVTLDALVKQQGPLPIDYACALMRQAALGLQHAHEKEMVHRDIKPGNLLIPRSEGEQPGDVLVKILDFGLARLQGKTKGDTIALRGEKGVLGTPDYISPEQSRDIHAADIRSDLYSLGCAFYFALAGSVPFPGEHAMEKLIKHLTEQPEPVEKRRPDVPPAVSAIVRRLMAKDPAQRYQTPAELVQELELVGQASLLVPSGAAQARMLVPRVGLPAAPTAEQPLWLSPPTRLPESRPATSEMPECTRILDNVEVIAPSRRAAESSGPSLLEPLWKHAPEAQRSPETRDTLTLSRAEDTGEVASQALDKSPPAAAQGCGLVSRPDHDDDDTQQELRSSATMAGPHNADGDLPPIDPVVTRLWQRWTELVETIVVSGPSGVKADTYRTIHTLLTQACRAAIDATQHPERRAFYEECLSIAQPWLKPQTFAHSESGMLDSLLGCCRQIDGELNGGKPPWTIRQCIGLLLLTLSPLGAVFWYVRVGRRWLPSLLETFDEELSLASLRLAWRFLQHHPTLLMGAIFPLVVIFSISLLSRTPRS